MDRRLEAREGNGLTVRDTEREREIRDGNRYTVRGERREQTGG